MQAALLVLNFLLGHFIENVMSTGLTKKCTVTTFTIESSVGRRVTRGNTSGNCGEVVMGAMFLNSLYVVTDGESSLERGKGKPGDFSAGKTVITTFQNRVPLEYIVKKSVVENHKAQASLPSQLRVISSLHVNELDAVIQKYISNYSKTIEIKANWDLYKTIAMEDGKFETSK